MDGNKDEALKCADIGCRALKEGDKIRAHRFLSKAQRLDPSLSFQDLISSLEKEKSEKDQGLDASAGENSFNDPQSGEETSLQGGRPRSCSIDGANETTPEYTTEQEDIVRRLRKTRDYYQILGVEKECSIEEVKKAYRKLSLKVHPDKNKAPGADEAFKAVSRAFACLSDPELRKKYDQYGPEEANGVAQQQWGRFRRHHRNGFVYDDMFDLDPNEIFNTFFNGSPYTANGFQRTYHMRTQRSQHVHTREVHSGSLVQLLIIVIIFLLSYIPFLSKPIYSLQHVAPYEVQYETKLNTVPFYVKSQDFDKDYPPQSQSRRNLEMQIEGEYLDDLRYNCRQEYGWKRWDPSIKTPNCDKLRSFKVY
ncbi:hypothetical protein KP509_10G000900 [Ceratopteris richardii]|uniref:J domain-containing protein n=1 Tax=Ceratopteris richardii TaxID=49495 RepID=A0A8T2TY94_CERRI|nr:hypothetical protein KP509_10G000900 [Ceratopteris richardii]KAH7426405.1 hypothetical protein KP509_10G000900 [Ceratopteris richardii]KAH7426406.1 hypothetical protein KP509_10G000900 [Ceratopteris richardii]